MSLIQKNIYISSVNKLLKYTNKLARKVIKYQRHYAIDRNNKNKIKEAWVDSVNVEEKLKCLKESF